MRLWEVWHDLASQQLDQRWLHELVVVWNAQAHDALASKVRVEPVRQLDLVFLLHDEDQLSPFNQLNGDGRFCILAQAGRCAFNAWMLGKYLLRRWTTPLVFTADKENVFHAGAHYV